ncbi:phosphatase PAP2 family protein [Candidatus Methylospira mobilis]|uniref:undecaprenyl-diphosphate phosphatase n=1 Tax=Candidatus Methylospira mobilis TaxID=1808979 RepID=A0A5Q0BNB8_9GAMM|nr:phosphatase PAP2 family protein [Candidatus Methylospira mobilis]QFY44652.1 phosphatase PAP2 family protein [Candidatus Methylospira mobilis]WNV05811.1 phosphatase PAP2 family protein [Candidatus Methylospira mobilis]
MRLIQSIHAFDVFLFGWISRLKYQKLQVALAKLISKTADGPVYLIFAIAYGFQGIVERDLVYCMFMAFLIERPTYFVLKNLFKRRRPTVALNIPGFIIPSDQFSFPSGHTSAAFLMATLLSSYYPALLPLLFTWASLVGLARVVLGVHFPTDTVIGALMGSSIALISMEFFLQ